MLFQSGPDALLRTPVPAFYARQIFDSAVVGTVSNVRKRLCTSGRRLSFIHLRVLSGSGPRGGNQFLSGSSGLQSLFLFFVHLLSAASDPAHLATVGFLPAAQINGIRNRYNGNGCTASLRTVRVAEFSVSVPGNRLCLSTSRHHSAAAEQQTWTTRDRVPPQVSPCVLNAHCASPWQH